MRGKALAPLAAITLVCFGGCASTATIARTDAPDNEAEIEHSDAEALHVFARGGGRIYRIPRESIAGIDHPGNVEILVGAILLGVFAITVIGTRDERDSNAIIAPLAVVYGGPGLGLLLSGMLHYIPSWQAARAFESAPSPMGTPPAPRAPMPASYPPPPGVIPTPPAPIAPPAPPGPERAPEPEVIPAPTPSNE